MVERRSENRCGGFVTGFGGGRMAGGIEGGGGRFGSKERTRKTNRGL